MKALFSRVISFLKWLYQPILKAAHFIGKVNTVVLLTIFYFIFLGFAKLTTVVLRRDLLDMRWKNRESYWKKREGFQIDRNSFLEPY